MVPPPADSHVDVLIVGAGPAGLMAATWMSRCGIKTRVVDKRGTKIFNGQADGLQCRTLEILDSFDFGHRVWREANHMLEVCLWNPDEQGVLRRSDRVADTPSGLSRFTEVVLNQGRIERFFLDSLKEHSDITVERGVLPESIILDDVDAYDRKAYPITVKLQHLTEEEAIPAASKVHSNGSDVQNGLFRSNLAKDDTEDIINAAKKNPRAGSLETVKAKYVIGCDGAHSWVRRQLGFAMEGEQTDYIWGVLDIIPITDFPDIRMRCAIHSENSGSVMVIPRENKLVRLYIQLTTTGKGEGQYDRSQITPEMILKSAQKIMAPYKIEYTYCDWWTAYQIGQRVGSKFSKNERIFLAGDAVHTHSPKAGQGMNVSMQDTYNLGWKVALVAKGICDPSILKTYQSERRKIAQDLIDFDHKFSRLFSGRPAKNILDEEGISMTEFKDTFKKAQLFTSGIGVDYGASMIVAKEGDSTAQGDGTNVRGKKTQVTGKQSLSSVIKIGTRMPSFQVINQADARPWQFQEILKSDGRWRIIVFAGNIKDPQQSARVHALGETLSQSESFLRRCTPAEAPIDSIVEVLTIHSAPRQEVELSDFHEAFHPFQKGIGWDYWKVYVDDMSYHEGHGQAYKNYDVDPDKGCIVVLRPDMYVSWIGDLEDTVDMQNFFEDFLFFVN